MNTSTPTTPVLADIADLTSRWLGEVVDAAITDIQVNPIVGEGYASRIYRLRIAYAATASGPASVILKLATVDTTQLEFMNDDILYREVRLYQNFHTSLTRLLPQIYYADCDEQQRQVTIVMADLGEIPHKATGETLEDSIRAMQLLAHCHAATWQSEQLSEPWLAPMNATLGTNILEGLITDSIAIEQAAEYSYPYLTKCMRHVGPLLKYLADESLRYKGPFSLIHGDFHSRNIYFNEDRGVVFDWQAAARGCPAEDVAYWILSSVDAANQHEFTPMIIEAYLAELRGLGIHHYTDKRFARAFNDMVGTLVARMYIFQKTVTLSEDDQALLPEYMQRIDRMARHHRILMSLRIGRVILPVIVTLRRWLRGASPD